MKPDTGWVIYFMFNPLVYMLGFVIENLERYGISSFCLCVISSVMSIIIHTQKSWLYPHADIYSRPTNNK